MNQWVMVASPIVGLIGVGIAAWAALESRRAARATQTIAELSKAEWQASRDDRDVARKDRQSQHQATQRAVLVRLQRETEENIRRSSNVSTARVPDSLVLDEWVILAPQIIEIDSAVFQAGKNLEIYVRQVNDAIETYHQIAQDSPMRKSEWNDLVNKEQIVEGPLRTLLGQINRALTLQLQQTEEEHKA